MTHVLQKLIFLYLVTKVFLSGHPTSNSNQQEVRGCFTLKYPPNGVDLLIFQNKTDQLETGFIFWSEP